MRYPLIPQLQNLPASANADLGASPSHHGHVVLGTGAGGTKPHALQVGCSPWALQQQCSAPSQHAAAEGGSSWEQDASTALCSLVADLLFYLLL